MRAIILQRREQEINAKRREQLPWPVKDNFHEYQQITGNVKNAVIPRNAVILQRKDRLPGLCQSRTRRGIVSPPREAIRNVKK